MSITTLQTIMYKVMIDLLKIIKEEKLNKRGQTVKKKEKFHGELQIRQKKFCVVHLLFFSLLCSLLSLCNFNFSQIIHFFNISIPKFQTGKTKLPTKNEGNFFWQMTTFW